MNNVCDLEEVKHIALQKFLELAKYPEKWACEPVYSYPNEYRFYKLGKFSVYRSHNVSYLTEYVPQRTDYFSVNLSNQLLYSLSLIDKDTSPSDENYLAIKKIIDYHDELACERQKQRIIDDTKKSCLALQKALEDPLSTKEEEPISNNNPYCLDKKKSWLRQLFKPKDFQDF